jgi:hypothetical protein
VTFELLLWKFDKLVDILQKLWDRVLERNFARFKRTFSVCFEVLGVVPCLDWDGVIKVDIVEEVVCEVDPCWDKSRLTAGRKVTGYPRYCQN